MIRVSEVGLGVDVIDAYQSSVYGVPPNVILVASVDRNVDWKGSQMVMGTMEYGGTKVYDFFGPSSFFPISEPEDRSKPCDTDRVFSTYPAALHPAPALVWPGFECWVWLCRIHSLVARKASH